MKTATSNTPPPGKTPPKRTVVLVEDQKDIRESWTHLLNSFPEFTCVCACVSAEDALEKIPRLRPDIILMDIFLPRMSGIQCTARLKTLLPDTQIVMLTGMADDELIFLALEAGANGYLLKHTKPDALRAALVEVLHGGAPMTSQIARRVVRYFRQKNKLVDEGVGLTVREEELLTLLSKGYSNKEIGDKLSLSVGTIATYLKSIYRKMHVHSRTEAVARYLNAKPAAPEDDAKPRVK